MRHRFDKAENKITEISFFFVNKVSYWPMGCKQSWTKVRNSPFPPHIVEISQVEHFRLQLNVVTSSGLNHPDKTVKILRSLYWKCKQKSQSIHMCPNLNTMWTTFQSKHTSRMGGSDKCNNFLYTVIFGDPKVMPSPSPHPSEVCYCEGPLFFFLYSREVFSFLCKTDTNVLIFNIG